MNDLPQKRRESAEARYLALPENDPERIEVELRQWLGGDDRVCQFQLSVLTSCDHLSKSLEDYKAALVAFCRARLPKQSCDTIALASGADFARIYLEDLRRQAGSTIFGPLTKPHRAVILLLENPDWTDEQIAERVPTTLKQLARFSDYNYLRREMRFAKEGIPG
jgi:hypothetical protein